MLPNLNTLRVFESVARYQNFSLAAEELHLTQSAVAQRIRQLESDLDIVLFIRQARGLELTEAGLKYQHSIKTALAIINEATRAITQTPQHLVVSVPPSLGAKWLLPRMNEINDTFPHIELRIIASEKKTHFGTDGADFVIRFSQPPFDSTLHSECLSKINLCALASPTYINKNKKIERLADFAEHRLIEDAHENWGKLSKHIALPNASKVLRFEQTSLAIDAALAGQGICISPHMLVEQHLTNGELVLLRRIELSKEQGYFLLYPKNRNFVNDKHLVLKWLKVEMKKMEEKWIDWTRDS